MTTRTKVVHGWVQNQNCRRITLLSRENIDINNSNNNIYHDVMEEDEIAISE